MLRPYKNRDFSPEITKAVHGRQFEEYIAKHIPDMQRKDNNKLEMVIDLACEILREKSL